MRFTRQTHRSPSRGIASLLLLVLALPALRAIASPPVEATAAGFTVNTFSSDFTAQTVDMNNTLNRGYKWYLFNLYGTKADPAGVKINGDGSVTIEGGTTGAEGSLMTVAPYPGTNGWVGTSFGGGGYFESVMKFDPAVVTAAHKEGAGVWPAFWSLPMQGTFTSGDQWPGQPTGYQHNVEMDFFEADFWTSTTIYGAGLHDWYGIPNKTCAPGLCKVSMTNPSGQRNTPAGTNLNTYHTYGVLWVPATARTEGSFSAYFDGKLIGSTLTWTQYTNQPPTPVGKSWAFGRLDQEHLFFILSSGHAVPFTLKSVNVWQRSTTENLTNN